ncbi:hypothetical protein [Acidithiobacillus sp.]|uniref:type IV pilus assembly protein FimV n=1 Tax=Acidithiobacillus sp. TaxID=1872118 RepID=UPI0025B97F37|nr:hypothetical protein [Acidithiobacillus sp.]
MSLPLSSQILILLLGAMLVAAVLWKWRQSRALKRSGNSLPTARETRVQKPVARTTPPEAPKPSASKKAMGAARVEEVSLFDEVEIYLSYGHLEQAATALRWYVDHHPEDVAQRRRLLDVYLEIPDIDAYAEVLENSVQAKATPLDEARERIFLGLERDPQNLGLRVLGESALGLDPADIDRELNRRRPEDRRPQAAARADGAPLLADTQRNLEQIIVHPEPLSLQDIHLDGFARKEPSHGENRSVPLDATQLVHGPAEALPLDDAQVEIIAAMESPQRAVALLLEAGQAAKAEALLWRWVLLRPRQIGLQVQLLELIYRQRRAEDYGRALVFLYVTLWGAGQALRQRLLKLGRSLADLPLWDALAETDAAPARLAALADEDGIYLPITAIPLSSPALVQERLRRDHQMLGDDTQKDGILAEFNGLLEYGQVEEAVALLEGAILAKPERELYYPLLLEMYERMQTAERFAQFTQKVLASPHPPGETVVRQMYHLAERLQRRQRHNV